MLIYYHLTPRHTICVDACYGDFGDVRIPEILCGAPVTELSAYAFSDANEPASGTGHFFYDTESELPRPIPAAPLLPPRIAGKRLSSLALPQNLRKIGRYAFYNCASLSVLSFYSTTTDLGAGLFMGCDGIETVHAYVNEAERSSLHEVLLALRQPLCLFYYTQEESRLQADSHLQRKADLRDDSHLQDAPLRQVDSHLEGAADLRFNADTAQHWNLKYQLVFPEYFENEDENTPARITMRDLHGSGLYYRNCFANTRFQIERYDPLLPYAVANESAEVSTTLALFRLLLPTDLQAKQRSGYEAVLAEEPAVLIRLLAKLRNAQLLRAASLRALLSAPFAPGAKAPSAPASSENHRAAALSAEETTNTVPVPNLPTENCAGSPSLLSEDDAFLSSLLDEAAKQQQLSLLSLLMDIRAERLRAKASASRRAEIGSDLRPAHSPDTAAPAASIASAHEPSSCDAVLSASSESAAAAQEMPDAPGTPQPDAAKKKSAPARRRRFELP